MKNTTFVLIAAQVLALLGVSAAAEEVSSAADVTVSTWVAPAPEPYVWPVAREIGGKKTRIVSGLGKRNVPPSAPGVVPANDTTKIEMHEGIDIAVPAGSTVRTAKSGKVLFAGFSKAYVSRKDKTDQAHLVIVRHADGQSTRYVHLNLIKVRPMQELAAGAIIGTSSESDEWKEPVLHFEIREANGRVLDPAPLLGEGAKP